MREALKRCSPDTFKAAWAFRQSGDVRHIPTIVRGVIERYMDRDMRAKLGGVSEQLRLSEDLGIDSLTLMEIVILAEDVFPISIHNEELCSLKTVGDITRFIASKLQLGPPMLAPVANAS
jgi:3-hydroxyacyl-[acyl-carrier-protein] dehydratase